MLLRRPWRWRCCSRLRFWLGRSRSGAGRAAADIDHSAVAALHFGIHPAEYEDAAVEMNYFPILGATWLGFSRPDVGFAARRAFQPQFGRRRLIGKVHHHAAGRTECYDVGLLAPSDSSRLSARAIFFLVIGRKSPTSNDILRREGWWERLNPCRRRRLFK